MTAEGAREREPLRMADLQPIARAFARELAALRGTLEPPPNGWYGYDILGNVEHLAALLGGRFELGQLAPNGTAVDVGGADGDLAFLLERLGLRVTLVDLAAANWNGLLGARRLAQALRSTVQVHDLDVDEAPALPAPAGGFDLAVVLGILYHLRNPLRVLQLVRRSARRCLVSTRIARELPGRRGRMEDAPVCYLLGPDECNGDATNWWVPSRAAFVRMAERTGWRVVRELRVGDVRRSNPVDPQHDERLFALLE